MYREVPVYYRNVQYKLTQYTSLVNGDVLARCVADAKSLTGWRSEMTSISVMNQELIHLLNSTAQRLVYHAMVNPQNHMLPSEGYSG